MPGYLIEKKSYNAWKPDQELLTKITLSESIIIEVDREKRMTLMLICFTHIHNVKPLITKSISELSPALGSYCCCNKFPQKEELTIAQVYYITVLEVQSPKWVSLEQNQGVGLARLLPAALWGSVSLPLEASRSYYTS